MASRLWGWQGSAVVCSPGTSGWENLYPGHHCLDKVGHPCPPVLPSRTRWDHTLEWLLTCLCALLQGKPKPEVIWTKDGQPLDTNHINIRTTERDTIFYIRNAQRNDSGKYELTVRINGAEDKATLDIRVIGKAGDGTCHSGSQDQPASWLGDGSRSGWDGKRSAIRRGTAVFLFQWDLLSRITKSSGFLPDPCPPQLLIPRVLQWVRRDLKRGARNGQGTECGVSETGYKLVRVCVCRATGPPPEPEAGGCVGV